ncbi:MAG TPA: IS3 family transposase [Acidimicrobiales bacterium]|nr:IS3 family transposase [Acidimicrobiales bacterium]
MTSSTAPRQPRISEELARRGWKVNHKRIERLMRLHGIAGVHKPAKVRTTIPVEDAPPLPDLIGRRFAPGRPDVAWVGDITYIHLHPHRRRLAVPGLGARPRVPAAVGLFHG